jgi:hypothetical protein
MRAAGQGRELAKRIIGITTIDYFGGDVDNAIEESIKLIRQRKNQLSMKSE